MRSPLMPLVAGALAVVLVTTAALVWALFLRTPDPAPASEVVIGASPESATAEPSDEDVVDPPPPITEHSPEGTGEDPAPSPAPGTDGPAPGSGPAPTGFPFDCLDGRTGHEHWDEDTWDDWWEACLDARFEDDDDD